MKRHPCLGSWASAVVLVAFAATAGAATSTGSNATIVNTPPHLDANTTLFLAEGGSGTITNLLLLATDPESPPTAITFTINPDGFGSPPAHGQLRLSGVPLGSGGTFTQDDIDNHRVTYVHDGSEGPTDQFQFGVKDGDGAPASDNGFVVFSFHMSLSPVNDRPVTFNDTYTINIGATFGDTLRATDPDSPSLTYSIVTNGVRGVANVTNPALGIFSYTPNPGEVGDDSFTFQVSDGALQALAPGTITIHIQNLAPIPAADSVVTIENNAVYGTLHATDADLPAQPISYAIAGNGSKGNAKLIDASTGQFVYIPAQEAIGLDSFTFTASDGIATSAPVTIKVKIRPQLGLGDILVTDQRSKSVVLIDPSSGQMATIAAGGGISSPRGVLADASGKVDVINTGTGLVRVDPLSGGQVTVSPGSNFTSSPLGVFGLAQEASGQLIVGDGTAGVLRVDPVTGAKSTVASGGNLNVVLDVVVAPNGDIYATDASAFAGGASKVVRIDPVSGAQTLITSGGNLAVPAGLALETSGMILVCDASTFAHLPADQVIRVDPGTGAQTVLASGGLLRTPTGIALTPSGDILLANQGGANILKVDPGTGSMSVLFADPALQQPFGIMTLGAPLLAVDGPKPLPDALELAPSPNPAVDRVRMDYALPREAHVRLGLYDISGRVVANLVDRVLPAGRYSASLDTRGMSAGVYFCRLDAGNTHRNQRLVIAR
jgi:sugar lactone lactonase YvrE